MKQELKEEFTAVLNAELPGDGRMYRWITLSPLLSQLQASKTGTPLCNVCSQPAVDGSSCVNPVTEPSPKPRTYNADPSVQYGDAPVENDVINRPVHYTQGAIETWDYIVSQKLGYLEGNVIKYVSRYKHKNGLEDLKKAQAYLNKLISEYKE